MLEWVQGIFLTQGSNSHLLQWQVGSLLLNHRGSPEGRRVNNKLGSWTLSKRNPLHGIYSTEHVSYNYPYCYPH